MTSRVRRAQKASRDALSAAVPTAITDAHGHTYRLQALPAADLPETARASIWDIFEANMRRFYVGSSLGWDPDAKCGELFHADARYVLVWRSAEASESEDQALAAYTTFRFDAEGGECVVYCYELQVAQHARRAGLGKVLMQLLWDIGQRLSMDKVMLTVFKENEAAFAFYKSIGYEVDPISPGYDGGDEEEWGDEDERVDYWIMSRKI